MKYNRIICALIAVMMLTTSAFAATSNVIKIDNVVKGSDITINVTYADGYSDRGTVYVIPASNLTDAANGDISKAVFVDESDAVTATPSYTFVMPQSNRKDYSGVYAIVIDGGVPGTKNNTRKFMYNETASEVTARIDALKSASNPVTALTDGAADAWYIDTEDPAWVSASAKVASLTKSMSEDATEGADVEDAFVIACAFVNANAADLETIAEKYNEIAELSTTDSIYTNNKTAVLSKFAELLNAENPENKDAVQRLFVKACAFTGLNTAGADTTIKVLKDYNEIFNLSFTGDYLAVNTLQLAEKFVGKNFQTVEQVQTAFTEGIAALKGSQPSLGGGGGGGSASSAVVGGDKGQEIIDNITNADPSFTDISGHWAEAYIEYVFENHIMNGDPIGTFRPDDAITREEWAKVVLNTFGFSIGNAESTFKDVSKNDWFYPYVSRAFELGIIKGVSEDEFGTGLSVSRQDAMVMMNRAFKLIYDSSTSELGTVLIAENLNPVTFEDMDAVAEYADEAIRTFAVLKVINGYEDGTVKPNGSITRAESAKIIKELLYAVNK